MCNYIVCRCSLALPHDTVLDTQVNHTALRAVSSFKFEMLCTCVFIAHGREQEVAAGLDAVSRLSMPSTHLHSVTNEVHTILMHGDRSIDERYASLILTRQYG